MFDRVLLHAVVSGVLTFVAGTVGGVLYSPGVGVVATLVTVSGCFAHFLYLLRAGKV